MDDLLTSYISLVLANLNKDKKKMPAGSRPDSQGR